MSTETAPPPEAKTETKPEIPAGNEGKDGTQATKTETTPAPEKKGSLLDTLNIVAPGIEVRKADQTDKPNKEEANPEAKTEQAKVEETKTDAAKPEPSPEEKKAWSSKAREAFDTLEKDRNRERDARKSHETKLQETEAELAKVRSDLEKAKTEAPRIEQYEKQIADLRTELRAASVERDPEFVEKFVKSRDKRLSELKAMAKQAGATDEDFDRAVRFGDDDKLAEWRESLQGKTRVAWDAHLTAIANLDFEKQEALADAGKTYEQIVARRQQAWREQEKQIITKNVELAGSVADKIFDKAEFLKDPENEPVRAAVKEVLSGVAGAKDAERWTPEVIMGHVGMAIVQDHLLKIQHKVIEGKDEELKVVTEERDKLKKELEEKNAFIQSSANGMPRSENFSFAPSSNGERKSLLDEVRIHAPGIAS